MNTPREEREAELREIVRQAALTRDKRDVWINRLEGAVVTAGAALLVWCALAYGL